ncbi:cytochrome c nitrite reductase subunit NrfD [Glaesserella parasuis]|uniref:cytochrome c nitrite reductase subunit NrfD n=1 Tax=Glaesserella parasuis TaxID=738 RepID=UPI0007A04D6E|nr:cytochrome c nitrite reductase subunit NrfD [Glaesserella parasuis]AMW16978.1 cytochrome c nitrite reductase subunit NrfD [Glaesserella parasuis]MDG6255434.1 cytochrome c nitrite reductase subunit NrfD [Glaesserella parasuis]MDG6272319.1 cytochrome c nitrite reductase subunit NrfD [Glaesserella parasuis]MDG6308082.1 cytochrome c nitrite reductase subunit NrfD [Glaesserella parasuis]MDG6343279.1 cytochrome c nitrite reductase subunit NrfD [Glaesserella parasuis]
MNDYVPFQTPNLVWDSTIAIYLFLLGISAGSTLLAVLYKRKASLADPSQSWMIRTMAIMSPLATIIGLTLLIFHLARPWTFWYLMFNYQFDSVMSMGVMLFQVFMAVLVVWLAIIFKNWLSGFGFIPKFAFGLIDIAAKFTSLIEILLILLSLALGAYTGFLLSELISYPMLNNPVLPVLFLASGTSSGIAALLVVILVVGKVATDSHEVHFLHKFEKPVALIEMLLLAGFFAYLYAKGGQSAVAADNALAFSGYWGKMFWVGVVAIGLVIPMLLNIVSPANVKHQKGFILFLAVLGLIGVLCLRYFVLYAGQMTIA